MYLYVCMYVYIHTYIYTISHVCHCVSVHYECICVCTYVSIHPYLQYHVSLCECTLWMYLCMYVCIYTSILAISRVSLCECTLWMYLCMYVCMNVLMYFILFSLTQVCRYVSNTTPNYGSNTTFTKHEWIARINHTHWWLNSLFRRVARWVERWFIYN